ncbi:MAG: DapH/DapD/GlmU-related protein [Sedimentisphaerales bacterium]
MNRCSNDENTVTDKNLEKSSCMVENLGNSIRPNPSGDWPQVDSTAYVDLTAQIIGNVRIGPHVYIGPNAVIRADETDDKGEVLPIEIGDECNVQDGVIIHALRGTQVTVSPRTSLSHGCIIHGPCIIGQGCFIGFRATIFNTKLGDGVFVSTGAVVQGVDLVANALVLPLVAVLSGEDIVKSVSTTSPAECRFMRNIVNTNLVLTKGYLRLVRQEQK